MALIIDPDNLSQGALTSPSDAAWTASAGAVTTITGAASLPSVSAGMFFEVRDHSVPGNNGLYQETGGTPTTSSITATKQTGINPVNAAAEAIRTFGTDASAATEKSIHIDVDGRELWIIEQGNVLSPDGVDGQAKYSFLKEEWKSDADLIAHPFPMNSIAADAGKYEFIDDWKPHDQVSPAIQTRKLLRNAGWSELATGGKLERQYVGIRTLGSFAEVTDQVHYQLGKDETDTAAAVDFDFAGPVNEPILTYDDLGLVGGGTGVVLAAGGRILTRSDGGNWVTDGYVVGGRITIPVAENADNLGTFIITAVENAVDGDLTLGTDARPITGTGFDFVDGGGGNDQIVRNDGGSWRLEGYFVGGTIVVTNATIGANDVTATILALSVDGLTLDVATATLTADTDDNTATFGPIDITGSPDTIMEAAVDNRNAIALFIREPFTTALDPDSGKKFDSADLAAIQVLEVDNKQFSFPLSSEADLKVATSDADISSMTPWTEIDIRYLPLSGGLAYQRDVDSATNRDFGVVVDVGTHSGNDGSTAGTSVLTSAAGGIPVSTYDGGTLTMHSGPDEGTTFPIVSTTATTVTVTGTFGTAGNQSFSLQRSSAVVATAEQIYEKIQWLLRQNATINDLAAVVTGATADEVLEFVGETLKTKQVLNPATDRLDGVMTEGFDANDTNRLVFVDNSDTERTFPFVAAGTMTFNDNLVNDTDPEFWMIFEYTTRTTVTDLALSGASGDTASLDSAGANLPVLAQDDHIALAGFTGAESVNNGVWIVTDAAPTASQADIRKVNGDTVVDATGASRTLDENPIDSPDFIIVNDNLGSPINGNISAADIGFDFDYDGNTQGGRTAATDASVIIRAIGLELGQFVSAGPFTITRNVGLTFSVTAALERNYLNP